MASKRKLKKEIVTLVGQLYEEALLLRLLSNDETVAKIEDFIDDLIVFTDDTIRRVQNPDATHNAPLVRAYYRKLRADVAQAEQAFNARLNEYITEA